MFTDKVQYIVALISEFANKYGISDVQAAKYLSRYGAIDLCDKHYDYLHTQSFASSVSEIAAFCKRNGGEL